MKLPSSNRSVLMLVFVILGLPHPGRAADEKATALTATYGGQPPDLVPYNEIGEPYHRYYLEPPAVLPPDNPAISLPEQEVRIGLLAPLRDHPDVAFGKEMQEALTLLVDEANRSGGYKGKPYRIIEENALPLWGAAANSFSKLEEQGVSAIVGPYVSDDAHVALRISLKLEVPLVNTATTDPTLSEHAIPWMIRTCVTDRAYGQRLAQLIFRELHLKRVALFRENSSYGRRGHGSFRSAASRLGFPIPLEMRYKKGETDFAAQIARIRQEKPEAVVLLASPKEGGMAVRQMRRAGLDVPIFGFSLLVSQEFLDQAGDAAEGVTLVTDVDPNRHDPQLADFTRRYHSRFGHAPGATAIHTADGVRLLLATIERTGPRRRDVMAGLLELRGHPLHGMAGDGILDATASWLGPVILVKVERGHLSYLGTELPAR